ncbi:GNAT family N-acetyltransferase [Arthrobacter sp.]|uniref:GNAT family N-acetyltransferase n=1 Tax=Arthrobacter sp. TaxID=1667 RepID=UPI003A8E9166
MPPTAPEPPEPGPPDPHPGWLIRPPEPGEWPGIGAVVGAAFGADDPAEGHTVGALVDSLRRWWQQDRGFELVADAGGRVVGHVGMTRAYVDSLEKLHHVLVLSPLSVEPRWQGRGIGKALVRAALAGARDAGWPLVFLEGAPSFYPQLGFVEAGPAGFGKPSVRIPDAAFMVHATGAGPRIGGGALVYPEAFWETDTTGLRGEILRQLSPGLFEADGRGEGS